MNFYKTRHWEKKRSIILRRDKYECRECRRYGKTTVASMVHHIYPREDYPELSLISQNLLSLCNTCHQKMHARTSHELTDKGLEWTKRIGPPTSLLP
ncbi:HNH endonuclease [Jeotgalibacillus aurantiacus]|uniref:HNH endonuclease n=1 Tax=Jeotgalibacillus aurantiacus TaxID=2763266 RepID=UPI001D0A9899|nr:HNH endonuclease [Jeotgalibacillus aurantiacus]